MRLTTAHTAANKKRYKTNPLMAKDIFMKWRVIGETFRLQDTHCMHALTPTHYFLARDKHAKPRSLKDFFITGRLRLSNWAFVRVHERMLMLLSVASLRINLKEAVH